jgi:hypothetical protein
VSHGARDRTSSARLHHGRGTPPQATASARGRAALLFRLGASSSGAGNLKARNLRAANVRAGNVRAGNLKAGNLRPGNVSANNAGAGKLSIGAGGLTQQEQIPGEHAGRRNHDPPRGEPGPGDRRGSAREQHQDPEQPSASRHHPSASSPSGARPPAGIGTCPPRKKNLPAAVRAAHISRPESPNPGGHNGAIGSDANGRTYRASTRSRAGPQGTPRCLAMGFTPQPPWHEDPGPDGDDSEVEDRAAQRSSS